MRNFRTLVLAFAFLASSVSAVRADEVEFQGDRFRPQPVQHQGRTFWNLQDPEVKRLITRTAARLQWSSSGQTLMVLSPVRDTAWTPGGDTVSSNRRELKAPGLLQKSGDAALIEPDALMFALGLEVRPQQGTLLASPVVGAPALVANAAERTLKIPLSAAVRCESSEPQPGTLRLRFPGTAYAEKERRFLVDDVHVHATNEPGGAVLELTFPENWQGEVRPGLGLTEVLVACRPTFAFPRKAIGLSKAEFQRGQGADAVLLFADGPVQFHWRFDRDSKKLTVDMPGLKAQGDLPVVASPESGLQSGAFRAVGSEDQPVLRFEGQLTADSAFDFFEMQEVPGSLVLRVGSPGAVSPTADVGSAATSGYLGGRATIVLDPGHGGGDPGCVNRWLGVREKDVTLDVALRLRDLLTAQGWTVLMTREDDRDVSWAGSPDKVELQSRCDVANRNGADLFVSLHCNASVSSGAAGTSVYWYKEEDADLARSLEFALGERLGFEHDGLLRDGFYVLRNTEMPSVLVEMAFLTNAREGAMLADPSVRQRIAEELAAALAAHMSRR